MQADGAYQRLAGAARSAVGRLGAPTVAAAITVLVAYGSWQVFRWGGRQHQALIGDLAFFPVNGAAALWAWRVSLRQDLGAPTCRAWRLLSVALWLFLLGDALQLLYEVVLHQKAYPTWFDAAYLSFYVVALAGILSFSFRRRTRQERFRLLLDIGTVFVGGVTLIWYVALGPAVAAAAGPFDLADLVTYAYPVGDLLLLFGTLTLLWRGVPRLSVMSLRIFSVGLLVFIAADVSYDYITVNSGYLGGDPVDTLWFVALIILFVAAGYQLRVRLAGEFALPARPPVTRPSVLPFLAVAASYLLLTMVGLKHVSFNPLGGVLLGAVVLTVLVSVRQFAALRDNNRLAARYRELASIDGMTGLYNRRHFIDVAEGAFAHARWFSQSLVALMIDVDRFKEINDVFGHAVGDRVLAELAQACRDHVPAGRHRGPLRRRRVHDHDRGDEQRAGGPARGAAYQTPTRVTAGDGTPVPYTLSIGVAESAGCRDLPSLLARADLAMYEAKRAGGGCSRVFEGAEGTRS